MGLFNFFRKNNNNYVVGGNDTSSWTGEDFEFLIRCELDVDISQEDYDKLMTPDSFVWEKVNKNNWVYYQVGSDEFSYSWEPPGIQMTFNREIAYSKAREIADEIVKKIKDTGLSAELVVLASGKIFKF